MSDEYFEMLEIHRNQVADVERCKLMDELFDRQLKLVSLFIQEQNKLYFDLMMAGLYR